MHHFVCKISNIKIQIKIGQCFVISNKLALIDSLNLPKCGPCSCAHKQYTHAPHACGSHFSLCLRAINSAYYETMKCSMKLIYILCSFITLFLIYKYYDWMYVFGRNSTCINKIMMDKRKKHAFFSYETKTLSNFQRFG